VELRYIVFDTVLGWVGVLGSQKGLVKLVLPQSSSEKTLNLLIGLAVKWRDETLIEAEAGHFGDLPDRIRDYLNGKRVSFPDKLDLSWARPFESGVWQVTRLIPHGETRTYSWVASRSGVPKAARSVGQALARNVVPIVIPCHRVICSNGDLGGFSGGRDWKRRLLEIETVAAML